MIVEVKDAWKLFAETGLPEYYLLYASMKRMENSHVSDGPGPGSAGHGLQ